MGTLTVGSEFVSQKSAHKGVIAEIVENATGSMRVRLGWSLDYRFVNGGIITKQINSGLGICDPLG